MRGERLVLIDIIGSDRAELIEALFFMNRSRTVGCAGLRLDRLRANGSVSVIDLILAKDVRHQKGHALISPPACGRGI